MSISQLNGDLHHHPNRHSRQMIPCLSLTIENSQQWPVTTWSWSDGVEAMAHYQHTEERQNFGGLIGYLNRHIVSIYITTPWPLPCLSMSISLKYSSKMNRFHLCSLLVALLLLFTPRRIYAIRPSFTVPSTPAQQAFRPRAVHAPFASQTRDFFGSEKRRVPTGSNPLHNKR